MFAKPKEETSEVLVQEEKARMLSDREFWTNCVQYMIDEETISESSTKRVIDSADQLLRARRERFPV